MTRDELFGVGRVPPFPPPPPPQPVPPGPVEPATDFFRRAPGGGTQYIKPPDASWPGGPEDRTVVSGSLRSVSFSVPLTEEGVAWLEDWVEGLAAQQRRELGVDVWEGEGGSCLD